MTLLKAWWRRQSTRFALILMVFVVGSLVSMHMFERMLLSQVQAVTEAANVAFTRLFVNEAWNELRPMLDIEAKAHPRNNPSLSDVDMRVRRFAKGTDLIKVKIYNMQGLTVYSSDPSQLGEDKANNNGFLAAARGRVVSETNYRGKFGAFDGELYERNLVSSYVPVRGVQGVEAVVEIYADRTTSIEGVEAEIRKAWAYFGPSMVVAFLVVWLLAQSGPRSDNRHMANTTGQANDAKTDDSEHSTPEALLRETAQALRADGECLDQALQAHAKSPPDPATWQALRKPLQSLLARIDELHLIHGSEQLTPSMTTGSALPLGTQIESVITTFRERHANHGIEISGHVAPALANHRSSSTQAVARLVDLLLREAVQSNGPGQLRLNFQLGQSGAMNIEIVGTRASDGRLQEISDPAPSLSLSAARALAKALKGRIERTSTTSQGSWLSASVPLSS